jgi:4-amino-4-deoxy-L-arabinose transferase-like glycosyltransferase
MSHGAVRGARIIVAAAIAALFLASISTANPPGFYHDESDIALNAAGIAASGRDEHGALLPLYFSSFGDWKSGPYIYLLSGVFAVTGPSELAARALSATLGLAAVVLLGLLGARLSGRSSVGFATAALAAATPWLFEVTRLVFEVALEPLLLAALLVVLAGGRSRAAWSAPRCAALGLLLALVAYAYPAGRVLAPLLAAALLVFARRGRRRSVALTWLAFVVALVPMGVFELRHPHALLVRYHQVDVTRSKSFLGGVAAVVSNAVHDGSLWRWSVFGDPNPRHHVQGSGSLLVVGVALAVAGVVVLVRRRRWDRFWSFAVLGAIASVVPDALTNDQLHSLRSIGLPVFLVALAVPALGELRERWRDPLWLGAAAALVAGGVAQFALFQVDYRHSGPQRLDAFEAQFPDVFRAALATGRPVALLRADHNALGDGLWYARLWDVPVRVVEPGEAAPPHAVLVTSRGACRDCRALRSGGIFTAYETPSS